jgi:hypothetical protein
LTISATDRSEIRRSVIVSARRIRRTAPRGGSRHAAIHARSAGTAHPFDARAYGTRDLLSCSFLIGL